LKAATALGRAPQLNTEIKDETWYHTIALPDGTVTPGIFDMRGIAGLVPWPERLRGGRCLDVATCDGFWAFEMERRGAAEVVAIDVADPGDVDLTWEARGRIRRNGGNVAGTRAGRRFSYAREALSSRVERRPCSVYDLDPRVHGQFDIVFCGTLLLHLRDPVRALERMREVCVGELVLVECVDARLDLWPWHRPAGRFAPMPGQWWRLNTMGLKAVLRTAGFEVNFTSRRFVTPFGPGATRARGLRRPLAAARSALASRPALCALPGFVEALGLWRGTWDRILRARRRESG
jgi:tRNA (mo5U34)-methyltransferase